MEKPNGMGARALGRRRGGEVCAAGFASAELCATLDHWATIVSGVLVSLGIRRAATAPNTG